MLSALRLARSIHYQNKGTFVFCVILKRPYKNFSKAAFQRSKVPFEAFHYVKQQTYGFRTTQRLDVPPIIALFLRPILRIGAIIFGRAFKKWWKKKSLKEQEAYVGWFSKRKKILYGTLGLIFCGLFLYYITHIEIDPLTNRSRFIMFNKEQQVLLSRLIFEMHLEQNKDNLVSRSHPVFKTLLKLTDKLLTSNNDLESVKERQWTLTVIDSPMKNAYVLPGGNIFIFLGALDMVENEDQLATILSHEMAHALLLHSIELVSNGIILDVLIALPIAFIWAVFPDLVAGLLQLLGHLVIGIFHNLPYSRALENEADEVGLTLAAKACVDVREAAVFWGMMRTLTELEIEPNQIPWLSTHPDHGDRENRINAQTVKALELRKLHQCPALSPVDPREIFYKRTKAEHEARFKQRGII